MSFTGFVLCIILLVLSTPRALGSQAFEVGENNAELREAYQILAQQLAELTPVNARERIHSRKAKLALNEVFKLKLRVVQISETIHDADAATAKALQAELQSIRGDGRATHYYRGKDYPGLLSRYEAVLNYHLARLDM